MGDPGGGTIPVDKVIGRAFVIVWPFSRATMLSDSRHLRPAGAQGHRRRGGAPLRSLAGFAGAVPLVLLASSLGSRR